MKPESSAMHERIVKVAESGNGPLGQVITSGHHVLAADEPEALGGRDTGPDPFELLLAALGACTAMTLRLYAQRHAWPLDHVEVTLRHARQGTLSGELRDVFERKVAMSGTLTSEQRQRLIEIADRCPVSRTLQRGAEIATSLA